MNGELFSKVHTSLTTLLALQKSNKPLENGLSVLKTLLTEGTSVADKAELSATASAVIIGVRVLADGSLRSATYSSTVEYYASILNLIFKWENIQLSLKWTEHVRPLMAILLSDLSGSNHCVQLIISSIRGFLEYILSTEQLSQELLSTASTPLVGKLVSVCLDLITTESQSIESRLFSADIILLLSSTSQARNSLSVVLPGLISKLCAFLCSGTNTNVTLINSASHVIFITCTLCLKDGTFEEGDEQPTQKLAVRRTSKWAKLTAEKLIPLISNLLARLAQHRDETIRLSLLTDCRELSTSCKEGFENKLRPVVIDLVLLLLVDEQKRVSEKAASFFTEIRTPDSLVYINERLKQMAEKLPAAVRFKSESSSAMKQVIAMLIALDRSICMMALTRSPVLVDFLRALVTTIRVHLQRIPICLNEAHLIKDIMSSIPLMFDVEIRLVSQLCSVLAQKGGVEIIDLLTYEMRDCSQGDKIAFLILQSLVLESLPSEENTMPIKVLAETCCEELAEIPSEAVPKDQYIEDLSEDVTTSTVLSISLLACLTSSTKKLGASSNKILLHSIYRILQFCSSSNWVLASIADLALKDLAESQSANVSSFLMTHNSYLLSSVTLACRSFHAYTSAPLAFGAFLDRVDDPNAFGAVFHLVNSLLFALDTHKQDWNWIILRSLKSFSIAINRWFPDMKRQEIEETDDEEQKEEIPREITTMEQVLKRTKHFLSSDALPVRIIVMEILLQGFRFLRNFENQLLPMVHQNWLTLVNRLEDSNLESRRTAFLVLTEMAKITKTFVYRRIIYEAWPRIAKCLENNVQKKTALPQSTPFRLCETILSNLAEVLITIEMKADDWSNIRPTLDLFLVENVHLTLKKYSQSAISKIDEYLNAGTFQ